MMDLITEHFEAWTAAEIPQATEGRGRGRGANGQSPHGIKKLRELILELAVRGKLVPQDFNDEPASAMLNELKSKQKKLIHAGKAKPTKKHKNLGKADGYYEIPPNWKWEFLAYAPLLPIKDGDWVESKDQNPDGDVRLIQLADVGDHVYRDKSFRFMTASKAEKLNCTYLEKGDVLIARLPDPLGRSCVFPGDDRPCVTVVDVAICRCDNNFVNNRYLIIALNCQNTRNKIAEYATGTTRTRISTGNLGQIQIPIPPIAEQHRIVAKVDELMTLCDKLEQQQTDSNDTHQTLVETLLAALTTVADPAEFVVSWQRIAAHFDTLFTTEESIDQLKQTILQLAVMGKLVPQDPNDEPASTLLEKIAKEKARLIKEGKIKKQKPIIDFQGLDELKVQLPSHWAWVRMTDIADIVRGGSPRPAGDPRFYGGEIPFLKVADVSNVKGKMVEGCNYTIKEAGLRKTRFIDKRTTLLTNSGATLGIPAICDFPATFNDGIAAFVELTEFVFDEYLYLYLKSLSKWFIDIASRGQGQPNLNTDIIKATWFALPPLAEQHRIVAKVDELMALCDTLKERLHYAQITQVQLADAIVEKAVG